MKRRTKTQTQTKQLDNKALGAIAGGGLTFVGWSPISVIPPIRPK